MGIILNKDILRCVICFVYEAWIIEMIDHSRTATSGPTEVRICRPRWDAQNFAWLSSGLSTEFFPLCAVWIKLSVAQGQSTAQTRQSRKASDFIWTHLCSGLIDWEVGVKQEEKVDLKLPARFTREKLQWVWRIFLEETPNPSGSFSPRWWWMQIRYGSRNANQRELATLVQGQGRRFAHARILRTEKEMSCCVMRGQRGSRKAKKP